MSPQQIYSNYRGAIGNLKVGAWYDLPEFFMPSATFRLRLARKLGITLRTVRIKALNRVVTIRTK